MVFPDGPGTGMLWLRATNEKNSSPTYPMFFTVHRQHDTANNAQQNTCTRLDDGIVPHIPFFGSIVVGDTTFELSSSSKTHRAKSSSCTQRTQTRNMDASLNTVRNKLRSGEKLSTSDLSALEPLHDAIYEDDGTVFGGSGGSGHVRFDLEYLDRALLDGRPRNHGGKSSDRGPRLVRYVGKPS